MLPGVGGGELVVIAVVALLVVGPKDLPKLLRQLGRFVGKMRSMADDFRSSFDEMARQSELDDLRKEVEALRNSRPLPELDSVKNEINAIHGDIQNDIHSGVQPTAPAPVIDLATAETPAHMADPQMRGLPPQGKPEIAQDVVVKAPRVRKAASKPDKPKSEAKKSDAAKPAVKAAKKPATKIATQTPASQAPASQASTRKRSRVPAERAKSTVQ